MDPTPMPSTLTMTTTEPCDFWSEARRRFNAFLRRTQTEEDALTCQYCDLRHGAREDLLLHVSSKNHSCDL